MIWKFLKQNVLLPEGLNGIMLVDLICQQKLFDTALTPTIYHLSFDDNTDPNPNIFPYCEITHVME